MPSPRVPVSLRPNPPQPYFDKRPARAPTSLFVAVISTTSSTPATSSQCQQPSDLSFFFPFIPSSSSLCPSCSLLTPQANTIPNQKPPADNCYHKPTPSCSGAYFSSALLEEQLQMTTGSGGTDVAYLQSNFVPGLKEQLQMMRI